MHTYVHTYIHHTRIQNTQSPDVCTYVCILRWIVLMQSACSIHTLHFKCIHELRAVFKSVHTRWSTHASTCRQRRQSILARNVQRNLARMLTQFPGWQICVSESSNPRPNDGLLVHRDARMRIALDFDSLWKDPGMHACFYVCMYVMRIHMLGCRRFWNKHDAYTSTASRSIVLSTWHRRVTSLSHIHTHTYPRCDQPFHCIVE